MFFPIHFLFLFFEILGTRLSRPADAQLTGRSFFVSFSLWKLFSIQETRVVTIKNTSVLLALQTVKFKVIQSKFAVALEEQ